MNSRETGVWRKAQPSENRQPARGEVRQRFNNERDCLCLTVQEEEMTCLTISHRFEMYSGEERTVQGDLCC